MPVRTYSYRLMSVCIPLPPCYCAAFADSQLDSSHITCCARIAVLPVRGLFETQWGWCALGGTAVRFTSPTRARQAGRALDVPNSQFNTDLLNLYRLLSMAAMPLRP
jgi:hypothetical protein